MKAIIEDNIINKIVILDGDKYLIYDDGDYDLESGYDDGSDVDTIVSIRKRSINPEYVEENIWRSDKYIYMPINYFNYKTDYQWITIESTDKVVHNFYSHIPELAPKNRKPKDKELKVI